MQLGRKRRETYLILSLRMEVFLQTMAHVADDRRRVQCDAWQPRPSDIQR